MYTFILPLFITGNHQTSQGKAQPSYQSIHSEVTALATAQWA